MTGTILKGIGGFYYVFADGRIYECKAGGRLRNIKETPYAGDQVSVIPDGTDKGLISAVLPRKNLLSRPPIANIDVLLIVASCAPPVSDPYLIDKVAAIAIHSGIKPVIVLNKSDISENTGLYDVYKDSGIEVIKVSAYTKLGICELKKMTEGKISVMTGNSGVGKSSLLNAAFPSLLLDTGEISRKIGRGKNTTRRVELFPTDNGGMIADSPGFSSFEITKNDGIKKDDLQFIYPEIEPFFGKCRFSGCAHFKEPGCAVAEAAEKGIISKVRYENYKRIYQDLKDFKDWD